MINPPINVAARPALAVICLLACPAATRAQSFHLQPNPFFNHFTRVTMRVNAQGTEPGGANDAANFTRFPTTIPFIQTDHIEDHDPFVGTPTGHATGDVTYTFTQTRLLISFNLNRSSPQVGCGEDPADIHAEGRIFFTVDQPVTAKWFYRYQRKSQGLNPTPPAGFNFLIAPIDLDDTENNLDEGGIAEGGGSGGGFNCNLELQADTVYGIQYSIGTPSGCDVNTLNSASVTGFFTIEFFGACGPDVNNDHVVNTDDLLDVIDAWGPCPTPCPSYCAADPTGDCVVDTNDLLAVINAWGPAPPP